MTQTPRTHQPAYRWVILVAAGVMGFMTIGRRSTVSWWGQRAPGPR